MTDTSDNNLTKHLDVFKEIGNIGAGNAASALAGLLNKRISMTVPDAAVVPFNTIVDMMQGPETLVAGVLVDVSGELHGFNLLVLEMKDALAMISQALGKPVSEVASPGFELSELQRDTLMEIVNIIVGSFLSAISSFTGLSVVPSVPNLSIDMLGAIISIATIQYGQVGDTVLFLKTQFNDLEGEISGHFFLIPDYNSYKILINSLGLEG
ncbi:MAG: chemotaxis protein CheC [Oscillospiraceae bacterium]|nr:chemotaxis protein CheC [Oscillospiraceae bacterium]